MAGANSIDEAFIDLSYRGWETIKSGMGQLKSMGKDIGDSFDKLAGKATTTFASISAAVLGSTRAASPQIFDVFTGSLKALAMVIGASLTPLVVELTTYVANAIQWWVGLDKGTKDLIVSGVKWTAMITGVIVAFSTLNSVFGGFIVNAVKFAVANPLVVAFGAVVVLIAAAIMSIKDLDEHLDRTIKKAERLKKGDINEGDMTDETNRIKAIKDPKERAAAAQALIDSETKRKDDALKNFNRTDSFGEVDTLRMGWETIKGKIGLNSETTDLKKVQDSAGSNIGVATQIRDEALKGKDIKVKAAPQQADLFGNLAGLGLQQKAVQVGDLSSVWKNIQQSQQEDPSLAILKKLGVYQEANNELLKGVKDAIEKQNAALPVGG